MEQVLNSLARVIARDKKNDVARLVVIVLIFYVATKVNTIESRLTALEKALPVKVAGVN